MKRCLLLLVSALGLPSPSQAAENELEPAKTFVVIAGVLQWPGKNIPGFPTKFRKDEELYDVLRGRGVPAGQMKLLLDEQATYSGIKRGIEEIAAKAPADGTLIVYYCGHGSPCAKGDVCFANYDLVPRFPERTGLLASDLAQMVKGNFKGKRVLFLADCCFSGGLGKTAKALKDAGFATASVTSADETMISTGNWTFTQAVIDALKGETFADANADGTVTVGELAAEVALSMHALERQKGGFSDYGLSGEFKLGPAKKLPLTDLGKYKVGDFVIAPDAFAMRAGRIVGEDKKLAKVQFYDYTEKRVVTVPTDKLLAIPDGWGDKTKVFKFETIAGVGPDGVKPGEKATHEVEWGGRWYPATLLETKDGKTKVHFVGWDSTFDEWVTKERIRPVEKPKK